MGGLPSIYTSAHGWFGGIFPEYTIAPPSGLECQTAIEDWAWVAARGAPAPCVCRLRPILLWWMVCWAWSLVVRCVGPDKSLDWASLAICLILRFCAFLNGAFPTGSPCIWSYFLKSDDSTNTSGIWALLNVYVRISI
jgi:hypothetical protein